MEFWACYFAFFLLLIFGSGFKELETVISTDNIIIINRVAIVIQRGNTASVMDTNGKRRVAWLGYFCNILWLTILYVALNKHTSMFI